MLKQNIDFKTVDKLIASGFMHINIQREILQIISNIIPHICNPSSFCEH